MEINFERNPKYREAFATNDPQQILTILRLLTGNSIRTGHTILFLDEIQAAPEALAALRYFYEEVPELRVLAAGSLLEFALAAGDFSMPVGRVKYLYMGPIQFEDFLGALGHSDLVQYLRTISLADIRSGNMPGVVHEKLLGLLRQHWIVGGMPEAIASYAEHRDYSEVVRIQQSIVATYRDDFNKYSHGSIKQRVQVVFDRLPSMVGRKFKYVQASREHRVAELSTALQQLCMARVAYKVHHSSANGVPPGSWRRTPDHSAKGAKYPCSAKQGALKTDANSFGTSFLGAEVNERLFKVLYMDIGLMCSALDLNALDLNHEEMSLINRGALAEQFIGQHLLYSDHYSKRPSLYYWVREANNSSAEIDYLMTKGQVVIPVEIKAGSTGTLKSLHQFLSAKQSNFALRFNADVPSLLHDKRTQPQIQFDLLSLPLYLVEQAERLISGLYNA